jgi:serine/threonine protein kinase
MGGACSGAVAAVAPLMSLVQQPENFQIESVIGKGGYAVVYRGKIAKKREIAIKRTIFKDPVANEKEIDMAIAELNALLRAGEHCFIPKIYSAFHEQNSCYLMLDYQSGGDLRYHLKSYILFEECHVSYFVSCIGSALYHLHQRGIIHRDVKPENILLSGNGIPKLSDFGAAHIEEEMDSVPISTLSSGTLPYMAPEMLTRSKFHSYQSDYWSLGVTAYELLFNNRPYLRNCPKQFIRFSANQYHCLWDRLRPSTESLSTEPSPASLAPSIDVDFELIDETISFEDRHASLPFPDYPTTLLLEGDIELPFELTTPIPMLTYAGASVSKECIEFLQALLDVRVPQRLGQLSKFSVFSNHLWFHQHQCIVTSADALPSCPYQPNIPLLQSHLQTKYRNDPLLHSPPCSCTSDVIIPDLIQKKLQSYFYSPSCPPSHGPSPSHGSLPPSQPLRTIAASSCDYSEDNYFRGSRSRS